MNLPRFMYGTAWKEERTTDLTEQALLAGFRAIDTANQRKHYFEEAVGLGVQKFLARGTCRREDLFLQTKFTFARGQDHRKPYNENDSFARQVADSFASSLQHLQTNVLDSYMLHGPYQNRGICDADLEAWAAMEKCVDDSQVKYLGISNVTAAQLSELCEKVRIRPRFVQNRCYARFGWDKQVREVCSRFDLAYQGFSLLTANVDELSTPTVVAVARKHQRTIPQVVFRFCRQLGMISLTGTSNVEHMRQDLHIEDFELSPEEVSALEGIGI